MNIAIDIRALVGAKVSGVTVYITNLIKELRKADHKNKYFLYYNGHFPPKDLDFGLPIVWTKIPNKLFNLLLAFWRWPKLDKLIEKKTGKKIDVFFVPDPRPSPVSNGCKKITTFHDLSFIRYPESFSGKTRLWHKVLNPKKEAIESDKIIAVSNFTKRELTDIYNILDDKIKVVYHGVDDNFQKITNKNELEKVRRKYDLPNKFILSLSTLEPRKNIDNLIKAFLSLRENNEYDGFLIIGGEENRKIFKSVNLKKEKNIQFIGFVCEEDKAALYSLAELFVFPSFYEGFGFPVLEATKCGIPVVTSKGSAMEEILGSAGIYVESKDFADMGKGIRKGLRLKDDPEFKKKAQEKVSFYSWRKCAEETIKVF